MIPKIIHYCWFGKGLIPASHKECMKTWKEHMPTWEIMCWNEENFDLNNYQYAKEAYSNKKYAFVADVARLYALYNYGGVYLDTDVEIFKPLDSFIEYDFFSGIEIYKDKFDKEGVILLDNNHLPINKNIPIPWLGFVSAVIGSISGNKLIKDSLDYYANKTGYLNGNFNPIIIDGLLAMNAVKYGFKYKDVKQELDENMVIFPSTIFAYDGGVKDDNSVLYHHAEQSWQSKSNRDKLMLKLDKLHLLKFYKRCGKLKRRIFGIFRRNN